ncbi:DUF3383 family protein [Photorhabdus laumondii subsp. laumondii]|uniref:DUF3383 family protein n=1 Tax=Photorhabdus laumondii subsp. laumondii TaxID=141679 RepID=A0A6L9JUL6_PHOLM|nr:DUF3383 family protein [Photorhabdus laumondii]MCC8385315.1 DUF3383 family protein [Photorhabdus laumondii]MCC8414091.1 DUF3383 family protein [Photorhabdus laumondii]NDK96974.1 DUF3383 family protein [Photorhabdus laumondii subsp. laumondii]NDL23187.1 DUF3383 family protein [Photorhabdus laumondii subsp. laumondii]NDL32168.1 DUF3383 family protein [Photorhabdus laumondii subsp. laumondii]
MSYSVDNIIPVNLLLTPAGLGYADFSSAMIFADATDLVDKVKFEAGTFRDYNSTSGIAADFKTDSDIYRIATRYFANIPKPPQITVWMKNPTESLVENMNSAADALWRYHYFFKNADVTKESVIKIADWADANGHPIWLTFSDDVIVDPNIKDDVISILKTKGNRHVFAGYKSPSSVKTDPTQAYAMIQLAAAFHKFRPAGINTAITGEFQVLPGVIGDDLKTSAYNALKAKNSVFFTQIELTGQTDNSRVINSKSMSSYGEFIDDVVNLDVLKNYIQVDGYNYIAGAGSKRALTPRDYGGLLTTISDTCKRFYNNGVLGTGSYVDPDDGKTKVAQFGFILRSKPEDVLNLTSSQRKQRQYPSTSLLVILARAGHVAEININVE